MACWYTCKDAGHSDTSNNIEVLRMWVLNITLRLE